MNWFNYSALGKAMSLVTSRLTENVLGFLQVKAEETGNFHHDKHCCYLNNDEL